MGLLGAMNRESGYRILWIYSPRKVGSVGEH